RLDSSAATRDEYRSEPTMTSRQRVLMVLNHEEPDRVPIHDSPWGHTIARWHKEGLPENVGPAEHFGYEFTGQGIDASLQLKHEVIEETDTYTIYRDANGATRRTFKDHESTPELIDFTVTSPELWEQYKPRMAWNESRVDWDNALKANRAAREQGKFVTYNGVVGYDKIQGMVGSERLLIAMAEDREWVLDMFETAVDLLIRGCDEMLARGFEFDGAFICDDMGYRNGTLFSPAAFRETEFPTQKRMYDYFNTKGLPVILHSCGCVKEFVPMLIEAGLTCLQPLEVKAGMDLVELKHDYGDKLAFMGGIDVRAMADPDPSVIEKEISTKIPVAKQGGGYIYHSDHSVPSNVSFQQYCRVMELVREYGAY
ncbi:MAG: uroporphyrinogen decarboxylase family protein, partial [Armatimonadota bacterium]